MRENLWGLFMRKFKIKMIILACGILFPHAINAEISGIGFAQTNQEAKKEALADLAQVIKSEVRSSFESSTTNTSSKAKSNIKISSNLPILGADFTFVDRALEVEASVKLTPQKVNRLYTQKPQNLNTEINALLKEVNNATTSTLKLKLYEAIFSLLNEYDRYESVAVILGAELAQRAPITKAKVQVALEKLNSSIDSLAMAATILAKSFTEEKIFVYPPLLQNNTSVAEFGSLFQKELLSKLKSAKSPKDASFLLVGEYILTKNAMVLHYALLDTKTNEVVRSKTININPHAYKDVVTQSKEVDFDALLNAGVISSSDLKVSLNSNRGSENLLFKNEEEIELFVKLNKMGYLYIVGYTQTKERKLSYLLELSEGEGDSRFVKFVNADDASRWISLGIFTIEPPFGVESIQVIASNQKITSLPHAEYDEQSGYHIISKDIEKALSQTRGLKKKVSQKVEMSEDVMSFTTMKK